MGEVSSLGKPPGWSHRKAMRDYIRSIGAFDRELHKEVARQNAANKVTESVVQQIIHDPLPIVSIEAIDGAVVHASSARDPLPVMMSGMQEYTGPLDGVTRLSGGGLMLESVSITHVDPLPTFETKPMISNRTGLRDAMAAIKEKAASARDKSLAASEKVKEAFEHQARVTESVERYADDVMKESNEVLAELGQFSNGGPE